jgi:pentatricopeptide repeat domain-containing protein 1
MQEAGLQPDIVSYTAAIAACRRRGGPERASADGSATVETSGYFAGKKGASAAAAASEAAAALVQDMLRQGLQPNRVAFNCALARCSWRHGVLLLDAMQVCATARAAVAVAVLYGVWYVLLW